MRELAIEHFVLAADDTYLLRTGEGAEGEFFLKVVQQGHYGESDARIASTWQGVYAFTPDGRLLGSEDDYSAGAIERLLLRSVDAWRELGDGDLGPTAAVDRAPEGSRWQHFYPHDGLVLRSHTRYLPHAAETRPGRRNTDYVWLTAEEASSLLPSRLEVGASRVVERALVERLARFHFVDSVPCLSQSFGADDVQTAELAVRVIAIEDDVVELRLEGQTRTIATSERPKAARWMRVSGSGPFVSQRGVTSRVSGRARYDRSAQRFLVFDLISIGQTWSTPWRPEGAEPAEPRHKPLGVLLTIASDDPAERVPPAFVELYGWSRPETIRRSARAGLVRAASASKSRSPNSRSKGSER